MSDVKSSKFVLIGQELGGAEEYLGDSETTFLENGKIYAATPGFVQIDQKARTIRVDAANESKRIIPKKGDTVVGTAFIVRKHSVGVNIYKLNKKIVEDGINATLHVSNLSRKYVDSIDDAIQKTDIIRGVIIGNAGNEWKIATTTMNSGVIHSDCKYCGTALVRKNRDQLQCPFCNNVERRILAPDYGMVNETISF